jgi:hypothetical protein
MRSRGRTLAEQEYQAKGVIGGGLSKDQEEMLERPAEVVVSRHPGALPPQLFHARPDRREIMAALDAAGQSRAAIVLPDAMPRANRARRLFCPTKSTVRSAPP